MDNSGNNRYEILFMDDDGVVPAHLGNGQTKQSADAEGQKAILLANKSPRAEKENKSSALNKTDAQMKKSTVSRGTGGKPNSSFSSKKDLSGSNVMPRKVAFTTQIEENFVQQKNTRYSQGEITKEKPEQRQFRDGRGTYRNRVGKREFDRQSGSDKTGVKSIDKREGAGAHNWGSVKQEIEDINKSTSDDPTLTDKEESSNDQVALQEEDETKEMTFDEWKAMRGERSKPQYNIRKPNEGEDTSQWKKMVALNRKKNEESSEEEFEYDPSMYPQRVGRVQRVVDIQFNFNDTRQSGGGFGRGRGRGRSFRSGGDNKGTRQEPTLRYIGERQLKLPPKALKVDDESQFPTLS